MIADFQAFQHFIIVLNKQYNEHWQECHKTMYWMNWVSDLLKIQQVITLI